jgi:rhodanese-related sulfurtransferase
MSLRRTTHPSLSPAEAAQAARRGELVLVDVREDAERANGFPPGSLHLPLGQLRARLGELPTDRPVAFVCRSGRRSAIATEEARGAGLDARNVEGGMGAWRRCDLEVEEGTA